MEAITQHLQTAALAMGAILYAFMAYDAYPKVRKVVLWALLALLLALMAWNKELPFYG